MTSLDGLFIKRLLLLALVLPAFSFCPAQLYSQQPVQPENSSSAQQMTEEQLKEKLHLSYEQLFDEAPTLLITKVEFQHVSKDLDDSRKSCSEHAKEGRKRYQKLAEKELEEIKKAGNKLSDEKRHTMHCEIQQWQSSEAQMKMLNEHLIPVAFDNSRAKLSILEKWPADLRQINTQIADESYLNRKWSDVREIGYRTIQKDQEDDIQLGDEAIKELRNKGALPKELDDQAVQDYVNTLAQRIAKHSDLKVPLHVVVLNSDEVNAFAFPGGFLFVQRGLLEAADDESELAGVLSHEMSHVVGRHGRRLMKKATISALVFQAAQIAAIVLTGGTAGIGTYYALQYGFYGLGLALNLNMLGVSREFEAEADQLGIQYAWASGYDPNGFVRFFGKMATKEGSVIGASWFRTHPVFYDRMMNARREIAFLPAKGQWIVQTTEFEQMKAELKRGEPKRKAEEQNRPTLLLEEEKCDPPKHLYKDGDFIDDICTEIVELQDRETAK